MMSHASTFHSASKTSSSFASKKEAILKQLAVSDEEYDDLSPKGSIDAEIVDFVHEINTYDMLVTTSSCSGRISVFLEGQKQKAGIEGLGSDDVAESVENGAPMQLPFQREIMVGIGGSAAKEMASKGGKGGGGRWLFVSHSPLSVTSTSTADTATNGSRLHLHELFEIQPASSTIPNQVNPEVDRLIHFKFEPMILHVLAANASIAQRVLSAALQCGFRESGISSLHLSASTSAETQHPVPLAIRTTGLAFDNIIGYSVETVSDTGITSEVDRALVNEEYLCMLVAVATEKFKINKQRTEKLRELLTKEFGADSAKYKSTEGEAEWEDKEVRRARKRAEGLLRKEALQRNAQKDHRHPAAAGDAERLHIGHESR